MANRQWDWNELARFQLTGLPPEWHETEVLQTKTKTKAQTSNPKTQDLLTPAPTPIPQILLDVQPVNQA